MTVMTVGKRQLTVSWERENPHRNRESRAYLLIDLIKVTIKTAEINISPPAATRPNETRKIVHTYAEFVPSSSPTSLMLDRWE